MAINYEDAIKEAEDIFGGARKAQKQRKTLKCIAIILGVVLTLLVISFGVYTAYRQGYDNGYGVGYETGRNITVYDSSDSSPAVYITKSGKKFHKKSCENIRNRETSVVSAKKAQELGYDRCSVCRP